MSLRSKLEGAALVVALATVIAFLVSAGTGVRLHSRPSAADSAAAPLAPDPAAGSVRVEVLNGGGHAGLARVATEKLRAAGYDVVYFGNSAEPRGISIALDRGGRDEAAHRVAAALGIRRVRTEPDANRFVDVTVLLGKDWPPPPPPVKESRLARTWKAIRSVF